MADSILDLSACGTTDIFGVLPDWSASPSLEMNYGREVIQFDEAVTAYRFLTNDLGWKTNAAYYNITREQEYAILSFFLAHKGRLNKFWLPVQSRYFQLGQDIANGAAFFYMHSNESFQHVYRGYERLFIKLNNGDTITRKITASQGNQKYSVQSVFDRAIAMSDVALFGKLILCRFDDDELAFEYITPELSTLSIGFQELAKEYV